MPRPPSSSCTATGANTTDSSRSSHTCEGIRIISPDLPGFGESDPLVGRAHDIAGYAEWLGAFVDALGLARHRGHPRSQFRHDRRRGGGRRRATDSARHPDQSDRGPGADGAKRLHEPTHPVLLPHGARSARAARRRAARQLAHRALHERVSRARPQTRRCGASFTTSTTPTSAATRTGTASSKGSRHPSARMSACSRRKSPSPPS